MTEEDDQETVKEISPTEAWRYLEVNRQAVLLDVRSRTEFDYVGHPLAAVNLPWQEFPAWQVDPAFAEKLTEQLLAKIKGDVAAVKHIPILCICRSGRRSIAAALALARIGFSEVYSVAEGFEGDRDDQKHRNTINGWRYHNLPWEQS